MTHIIKPTTVLIPGVNGLSLTTDSRGITLNIGINEILIGAYADQWDQAEANRTLNNLLSIYDGYSYEEVIDHFVGMAVEGI